MHYFLHSGIHGNAFTITQNALLLQLLPPCWGHSSQTRLHPLRWSSNAFCVLDPLLVRTFSCACHSAPVCLSVCRALPGKRLELSTPHSVKMPGLLIDREFRRSKDGLGW